MYILAGAGVPSGRPLWGTSAALLWGYPLRKIYHILGCELYSHRGGERELAWELEYNSLSSLSDLSQSSYLLLRTLTTLTTLDTPVTTADAPTRA